MIGSTRIASAVRATALGVGMAGAVVAPAASAQSPGDRSASRLAGGLDASPAAASIPVDVLNAVDTGAGLAVTLVNRSPKVIGAFLVGGARSDDANPSHFDAVLSAGGVEWQPGEERTVMLAVRPGDATLRVVMRAVVMNDGQGFGDDAFIKRTVQQWDRRRAGLADVLALLAVDVPTDDDAMQGMIDGIALRMARVPGGASAEQQLEPYTSAIARLKRLQHRDLGGTERLQRELDDLRAEVRRQRDGIPGVATTTPR